MRKPKNKYEKLVRTLQLKEIKRKQEERDNEPMSEGACIVGIILCLMFLIAMG